jgi:hypothetical protein
MAARAAISTRRSIWVGQPADRILHHQAAGEDRRDEERDLRHGQPGLGAIDRRHAELRREHAAQQKTPHRTQRRDAIERAQRHRLGPFEERRGRDRQKDRRERDRDEDRGDHEQEKARRVAHRHQALRDDDAGHLDDHVERQRLAAVLVRRGIVQPAFGRHIDRRIAKPDHDAHQRPDPGVGRHGIKQQCRRNQRGQRGEHPDMADPPDHRRRQLRAAQEAHEIGRHDKRHLQRRESLDRAAHTQQRALKPVCQHQQEQPEEERPGAFQNVDHARLLLGWRTG